MRVILVAVLVLWAVASWGNTLVCDKRKRIALWLATHGQFPIAQGLEKRQRIITVYHGPKANWSFVATDAKGQSCIIAFGVAWRDFRRGA